MGCFSLAWIEQLLIWLVVIAAVFALIRLVVPAFLPPFGTTIVQVLNIVLWAIVAIAVIILIFDLLSCAVGVPRLLH
jgi:uncharacterized membrane protein YccC